VGDPDHDEVLPAGRGRAPGSDDRDGDGFGGLWRPAPAGWVGVAVFFGFAGLIAALVLGSSLEDGWTSREALLGTAGFAYFTLAVASILAAMPSWTRWAEERLRRGAGSRA
jgi:hypothetical protein